MFGVLPWTELRVRKISLLVYSRSLLKGLCHVTAGCFILFKIPITHPFFARKIEKLLVNDKITSLVSISTVTNNGQIWKTIKPASFQKLQLSSVSIFSSKFFHPCLLVAVLYIPSFYVFSVLRGYFYVGSSSHCFHFDNFVAQLL